MKHLLLLLFFLAAPAANAATLAYDFSGPSPLEDFNHNGSSYQVVGEQLIPPLVSDFYNTTLTLKTPVAGGAGSEITITADFLYDMSLINPNPAEVPGLALFVDAGSSTARGEMRALGSVNTDVVAYSVTYDVNSRNEGNPVIALENDMWYRLLFNLQLVGGPFNDELLLTTELYKLNADTNQLVSSFSVDSFNFRMIEPDSLTNKPRS